MSDDDSARWPLTRKSGRPPSLPKTAEVMAQIEPWREKIVQKLCEMAALGDTQAARLVMERLAPPAKPESERFVVPGLAEALTLEDKASAVLAAVARGQISAEAGERALRLLDILNRAIETTRFDDRLRALEKGRRPAPVKADVVELDEPDVGDLC